MNRALTPAALLGFVRAAELGSFAAAARQLDVSPAAVGQAVQRLETELGVKLLSRSTRRMSLTAEGRLLLERSQRLVRELDDIHRIFDERANVVSGPLRISAPAGLARRYVLPIIARFIAEHPAVEVSLDCSDAIRDFAADPLDVAFRILRPSNSAVIARRLARLQAITVASPEYLRRHGMPKHPRELATRRCIVYRHPATGALAPLIFRVRGRDVTVTPSPSITLNDVDTACEAAALGLGIAQPPIYYAAPHLASKRLVPILDAFASAPWTLYLCYGNAKNLPQRVRRFVQFAQKAFASGSLVANDTPGI